MIVPATEAECFALIEELRFPFGFECPRCGSGDKPSRLLARPQVLRCRQCGGETSLLSGTIFERTRLSMCDWLRALRLFAESSEGVSVGELQRALGLSRYETAYGIAHRLRLATAEIEPRPLGETGAVLVSFLDGFERPVIFALDIEDHRLRLRDLRGDRVSDVEGFLSEFIADDVTVVTDDVVVAEAARSGGYQLEEPTPQEQRLLAEYISDIDQWFSLPAQRNATRHLRPLLNEYMFRRQYGDDVAEAFDMLLHNAVLRSAPGAKQIYSGRWTHPNRSRHLRPSDAPQS